MVISLDFKISKQPDEITCGPTCLHSIYMYNKDIRPIGSIINEIQTLDKGGTLATALGIHALKNGYSAKIITYNLQVFDPTWFSDTIDLKEKLRLQIEAKPNKRKIVYESKLAIEFLENGGKYRHEELTSGLIRKYLKRDIPIICGLSSTYLYQSAREKDDKKDDIGGFPVGHFVVLYGYDKETKDVYIADPLYPNPISDGQTYKAPIDRVVSSILLGTLTHDANLLIIEKRKVEE